MEQFYDKMSSKNEIGKYAVDDFVMKKIDVKVSFARRKKSGTK